MKKQVFLSFSNEDKPLAERIYDGLERQGVPCWMSSRDVPPGTDYQSCLVDAITAAELVVLVFSSSANVSQKVIKELSLASAKPMIAVRIEDVMPAGAFRQLIDGTVLHNLVGDFDARLEGFCRHVKAKLQAGAVAQAPLPIPTPAKSEGPRLAKPAIAVLVLTIAAVGVRAWRTSGAEPSFWVPGTTTFEPTKVPAASKAPPVVTPVVAPVTAPGDTRVDGPVATVVAAPEETPVATSVRADPPALATEVAKPRSDPKPKPPPVERRAPKPTVDAQVESGDRHPTEPAARVAVAWKPSFNCKYARTHAEHLICSNHDLAAADVELDRAYRAAQNASRDKRWLNEDQAAWRQSVRDPCPNVDCMLGAYEERIAELISYAR